MDIYIPTYPSVLAGFIKVESNIDQENALTHPFLTTYTHYVKVPPQKIYVCFVVVQNNDD